MSPEVPVMAITSSHRSHGRIQLQVLEYLYRNDASVRTCGGHVEFVAIDDIAGEGASRSRVLSIRRATQSLVEDGLVLLSEPASDQRRPSAMLAPKPQRAT